MKSDLEKTCADEMDAQLKVWTAEVEIAKVRFSKGMDLGIEFKNKIDAWTKMEFIFRQQILRLRADGGDGKYSRSVAKRGLKDLNALVYSIREKID